MFPFIGRGWKVLSFSMVLNVNVSYLMIKKYFDIGFFPNCSKNFHEWETYLTVKFTVNLRIISNSVSSMFSIIYTCCSSVVYAFIANNHLVTMGTDLMLCSNLVSSMLQLSGGRTFQNDLLLLIARLNISVMWYISSRPPSLSELIPMIFNMGLTH